MRHHAFAHVSLIATTPAEAAEAVAARPGSLSALRSAAADRITSRTCDDFSSADVRVLACHGLTRKVGQDHTGASILVASEKGCEVLLGLIERPVA